MGRGAPPGPPRVSAVMKRWNSALWRAVATSSAQYLNSTGRSDSARTCGAQAGRGRGAWGWARERGGPLALGGRQQQGRLRLRPAWAGACGAARAQCRAAQCRAGRGRCCVWGEVGKGWGAPQHQGGGGPGAHRGLQQLVHLGGVELADGAALVLHPPAGASGPGRAGAGAGAGRAIGLGRGRHLHCTAELRPGARWPVQPGSQGLGPWPLQAEASGTGQAGGGLVGGQAGKGEGGGASAASPTCRASRRRPPGARP
jgi:hypothetical protein